MISRLFAELTHTFVGTFTGLDESSQHERRDGVQRWRFRLTGRG